MVSNCGTFAGIKKDLKCLAILIVFVTFFGVGLLIRFFYLFKYLFVKSNERLLTKHRIFALLEAIKQLKTLLVICKKNKNKGRSYFGRQERRLVRV